MTSEEISRLKKEREVDSILRCVAFIIIGFFLIVSTIEEFKVSKEGTDFNSKEKGWVFSGERISVSYITTDFIMPSIVINILGWILVSLGLSYMYTIIIRLIMGG